MSEIVHKSIFKRIPVERVKQVLEKHLWEHLCEEHRKRVQRIELEINQDGSATAIYIVKEVSDDEET